MDRKRHSTNALVTTGDNWGGGLLHMPVTSRCAHSTCKGNRKPMRTLDVQENLHRGSILFIMQKCFLCRNTVMSNLRQIIVGTLEG